MTQNLCLSLSSKYEPFKALKRHCLRVYLSINDTRIQTGQVKVCVSYGPQRNIICEPHVLLSYSVSVHTVCGAVL